jgi:hypothetical protein
MPRPYPGRSANPGTDPDQECIHAEWSRIPGIDAGKPGAGPEAGRFSQREGIRRLALAAAGEKEKGRKAYQDFFATWTNADQDLPLFRLALSEYAGLK